MAASSAEWTRQTQRRELPPSAIWIVRILRAAGAPPCYITYLLHHGENPGFGIVISVGTNSLEKEEKSALGTAHRQVDDLEAYQVNLVGILVGPERPHETKERIFGRLGHDVGREIRC